MPFLRGMPCFDLGESVSDTTIMTHLHCNHAFIQSNDALNVITFPYNGCCVFKQIAFSFLKDVVYLADKHCMLGMCDSEDSDIH